MAKGNQLPKLVFGVAAAWAILRSAKGAYQAQVRDEVMKYRNKMYDVGPNCEITLKETDGEGGDAGEDLQRLWDEFVYPIVKGAWEDGKDELVDLTAAVMDELFPETQCVWPPVQASPESQVLAFNLMMTFVSNQLACEPGDPMPEGFECASFPVDQETATALGGGGFMLGMMAKDMGGAQALKEVDGQYELFIRAPKGD